MDAPDGDREPGEAVDGEEVDLLDEAPRAPPSKPAPLRDLSVKKLEKLKQRIERTGIVYMSRVPPHMKPARLRAMLEQCAEIGRIYMAPKTAPPSAQRKGKSSGPRQGRQFSEAWIEFKDKKQARAVAEMLNGSNMGGKHRSRYHDDLWTLKYLPKFRWDHLTEEAAYQKAVREKQLAQQIAVSKQERNFYLSNVAKAKKSEAILSRKRKAGQEVPPATKKPRVIPQRAATDGDANTRQLSSDVLSLFGSH